MHPRLHIPNAMAEGFTSTNHLLVPLTRLLSPRRARQKSHQRCTRDINAPDKVKSIFKAPHIYSVSGSNFLEILTRSGCIIGNRQSANTRVVSITKLKRKGERGQSCLTPHDVTSLAKARRPKWLEREFTDRKVRTRPPPLDFPCLGLGNLTVSQPSCFSRVAWQLGTERVLQLNASFFKATLRIELESGRMEDTPITQLDILLKKTEENKGKRIFVLFSGTPSENGVSWCPDCVAVKPVINEALKYLPEDSIFLTVLVGDRPAWRSSSNVFRTNSNCAISSIPTLIEFGTYATEENIGSSGSVDGRMSVHRAGQFDRGRFLTNRGDITSVSLRGEMAQWLEREFFDWKVRGSNPISVSRLPLSRLGRPGSIPTLVLPSGGTVVKHRKGATPERYDM
ncbi:Thioredoxin domain-containing protein 17 [Clonorchis sinensis]|uniref:Thioredoxin domain-containing protein 17 n=1 Tax=Clonorchis sinensis TaxID=79923 RepID=A0A419Q300_CLOSI|nr:Thioredoxin domain-containing protein 17 [Clonorchis sinensis]